MKKSEAEAYAAALRHEREGLVARGLKDRVKLVDAEIKRLGLDPEPDPEPEQETAEGNRGPERAVKARPKRA